MTKKHRLTKENGSIEEHVHSCDVDAEHERIELAEEATSYLPADVYAEILRRDDLNV